jgi:Tfp pilus assembly protein FimT
LLELMLVLAVVGAVLALSAPLLRGFFASRQTADCAQTVLFLTKWAHSRAVAQGQPCRLNVDAPSGTFWLTVQDAGRFVSPASGIGRRFRAPEGASVSLRTDLGDPAATYVQFYPTGRSDAATIRVQGRQGELYQVTCDSATDLFRVISPLEATGQ